MSDEERWIIGRAETAGDIKAEIAHKNDPTGYALPDAAPLGQIVEASDEFRQWLAAINDYPRTDPTKIPWAPVIPGSDMYDLGRVITIHAVRGNVVNSTQMSLGQSYVKCATEHDRKWDATDFARDMSRWPPGSPPLNAAVFEGGAEHYATPPRNGGLVNLLWVGAFLAVYHIGRPFDFLNKIPLRLRFGSDLVLGLGTVAFVVVALFGVSWVCHLFGWDW